MKFRGGMMLQNSDMLFFKKNNITIKEETRYDDQNFRFFFAIGTLLQKYVRIDVSFDSREIRLFSCVEDSTMINHPKITLITEHIQQSLSELPQFRLGLLLGNLSFRIFPVWSDPHIRIKKKTPRWLMSISLFVGLFFFIFSAFIFIGNICIVFLFSKWGERRT